MREFPHHYSVTAVAHPAGDVTLEGERLPPLATSTPAEFDGPGDRWSPETLMAAAVVDCFALTFRGIARVSNVPWTRLTSRVTGTLERVQRMPEFTEFAIEAVVQVPPGTNEEKVRRVLARAEEMCLIGNSLKGRRHLDVVVEVVDEQRVA